jgi:hypothetical protein
MMLDVGVLERLGSSAIHDFVDPIIALQLMVARDVVVLCILPGEQGNEQDPDEGDSREPLQPSHDQSSFVKVPETPKTAAFKRP